MGTDPKRAFLGPGERIGRYEILAEIATGGMAIVYAARLRGKGGFDKLYAIKALLPHLIDQRDFVNMFLDEARIAASVRHPNVVEILDLGEERGTPYIVMEYLRGRALSTVLRRARHLERPLHMGAALAILAAVAEGLHAAHEAHTETGEHLSIVHRDVSPQNIHVGYDGVVKVVDFGIAAAKGRLTQTRSDHIKGKLHYMAPEQIRKHNVDHGADMWALGVVAWELLCGERLFKDDDDAVTLWNVLNKEVPPLNGAVPAPVAEIVARMLQRNPYMRPSSCEIVAEVLRDAAREVGGDRTGDLEAYMEGLFAKERAVEAERLAASMREVPPPLQDESDDASSSMGLLPVGRAPRRRWLWPAAVSGAALTAAAIWVVAAVGVPASREEAGTLTAATDAPPAALGDPGPATPLPVAAPQANEEDDEGDSVVTDSDDAERTPDTDTTGAAEDPLKPIRVEVDPRATLVLVDGQRRTDRPLELALEDGESISIEVFGPEGQRQVRTLTREDDGAAIELPARRRRPSRAQRRQRREKARDTAKTQTSKGSEILRSDDIFR